MRKPPPKRAGAKASNKNSRAYCSEAFPVLQLSPSIDRVPSTDKNDVIDLWLSLARQGVVLRRPPGIVILPGGRA